MNPLLCLAYFVAGALREAAVVLYYRQLAKGRRFFVSGLAGGIELYDLAVLATIIKSDWSPTLVAAYVGGVVCGTFIGMCRGK